MLPLIQLVAPVGKNTNLKKFFGFISALASTATVNFAISSFFLKKNYGNTTLFIIHLDAILVAANLSESNAFETISAQRVIYTAGNATNTL